MQKTITYTTNKQENLEDICIDETELLKLDEFFKNNNPICNIKNPDENIPLYLWNNVVIADKRYEKHREVRFIASEQDLVEAAEYFKLRYS
jgi:hypothetical protein